MPQIGDIYHYNFKIMLHNTEQVAHEGNHHLLILGNEDRWGTTEVMFLEEGNIISLRIENSKYKVFRKVA